MLENKNNWFVLVTKPRNEKKVESRLNEIGVEAYCPVRTELRQWSDRKKKIKTPLLPSMLLVKIPNNLREFCVELVKLHKMYSKFVSAWIYSVSPDFQVVSSWQVFVTPLLRCGVVLALWGRAFFIIKKQLYYKNTKTSPF